MKRIIFPVPYPLFVTYCPECGVTFEYEEEDTFGNDVLCPGCSHECEHRPSNIKQR